MPDYFFKYKNDKIFSSGVQISYDNEFFSFGIVTHDYVEPFNHELIRLSVGVEDSEDLLDDLKQAFASI